MAVFAIADTTIRTSLHSAIVTAWAPTKIYDEDPFVPTSTANLPLAFVNLSGVTPDAEGYGAAVQHIALVHEYDITYLAKKPTTGTLAAAKVTAANALIAQLYGNIYLGSTNYLIEPGPIDFDTAVTAESAEAVYSVTVTAIITQVTARL